VITREFKPPVAHGPKREPLNDDGKHNNKHHSTKIVNENPRQKAQEIIETLKLANPRLGTLIHELKAFRNKWAHHADMTWRDVYRFLDSLELVFEELNLGKHHNFYIKVHNSRLQVIKLLAIEEKLM